MSHTITLSGNYGQTTYKASGLDAGSTIIAEGASWIEDNTTTDGDGSNPWPFRIYNSVDAYAYGGTIIGEIDQTAEWRTVYSWSNSAGIHLEEAPGVHIQDWRITNTWDAINISWNCDNFIVEDVWVTNARDDAIQNDKLSSGVIRDSLFDGVFAGLSIDPSSSSPVDGSHETVTLDGVLMRLTPFVYEGMYTHASFVKTDSATPNTVTPNLRFINNVIAIEDVNHRSYRSVSDAWEKQTADSTGNYYLNLSDTPLPADYPMPPAGWTVLQGQAARDYWNEARSTWIANHQGTDGTPSDGNAPTLDLDGSSSSAPQIFEKRVVSGLDDVEQRGRSMSMDSSDLELVNDGSTNQQVGLRFTGIDIPQGAIITKAYIQFQSDEVGSAATSLLIRGEDADDAAAFANVRNNVSSRATTAASAAWAPEAWNTVGQAGLAQRTVDLSDIVEEIVARSGWRSGNDMAFVITGSGTRTAEAFESGAATAPLLHVEYVVPDPTPVLTYNDFYI
jgi:hypothetical protein